MNSKTLILMSLLVASLSCTKIEEKSLVQGGEDRCSLTVSFDNLSTKVIGKPTADETNIKDVQVFVFDRNTQKLDAAIIQTGLNVSQGSCTLASKLDCTRGPKEIWALVNAPVNHVNGAGEDMISEISQLKNISTRLTDNEADALVMVGSVSLELSESVASALISVERLCAAVVIESITNDILLPAYQTASKVKIKSAYLMNVPNLQVYGKSMSASALKSTDWISPNQKTTDGSQLELTADSYSSPILDYGQKWENVSTFYAYPNDCTADPGSTWSPSRTVLVVEAEIDGQACIYPIRLGALKSNNKYMVNLTIRHMGCDPDEPWKKIEFTNMSASIKVVDWQSGGPSINETI